MAVRQGALDGEDLLDAGYGHAAAQQHLQALDDLLGPARQVGQGALADLAVLAVRLAQEHRSGRVAVRHGLDVHDCIYRSDPREIQAIMSYLHGYKLTQEKGRNPRQCWVTA